MKAYTKIAPSEGMYLTQSAEVAVQDRIYEPAWLALGINDKITNYREADEAEYQQWLADMEAYNAEQEKKMQEEMNPPTAEE